jgi:hypothetical protein
LVSFLRWFVPLNHRRLSDMERISSGLEVLCPMGGMNCSACGRIPPSNPRQDQFTGHGISEAIAGDIPCGVECGSGNHGNRFSIYTFAGACGGSLSSCAPAIADA